MSVETILSNVLLRLGFDKQGAQITSTDLVIRQIRNLMDEAGSDIAKRVEWSRMSGEFTVTGGATSVDLPDDFRELAESGTIWTLEAEPKEVRIVVIPEAWEFLTANPSVQPYAHISGGQLLFQPALPAEGARVRYVAKNWVSGGLENVAQNSDELLIPEHLVEKGVVWRWRRDKGRAYDDHMAEFEADLANAIKADRGAR